MRFAGDQEYEIQNVDELDDMARDFIAHIERVLGPNVGQTKVHLMFDAEAAPPRVVYDRTITSFREDKRPTGTHQEGLFE